MINIGMGRLFEVYCGESWSNVINVYSYYRMGHFEWSRDAMRRFASHFPGSNGRDFDTLPAHERQRSILAENTWVFSKLPMLLIDNYGWDGMRGFFTNAGSDVANGVRMRENIQDRLDYTVTTLSLAHDMDLSALFDFWAIPASGQAEASLAHLPPERIIAASYGLVPPSSEPPPVEPPSLEPATGLPFTDVHPDDWFFEAVEFIYKKGIMTGTRATTFLPNAHFSRAHIVTTLFRIHYDRPANADDSRTSSFTDVSAERWYAPYVAWAYSKALVDGVGSDIFAPNDPVTREQFATILFRYSGAVVDMDTTGQQGLQWDDFADRYQTASWAQDPLMWANYHGLLTGRTATTLALDDTLTRAEAAMILMRFLKM